MAALQKASVTFRAVHVLFLILRRISSALDSIISNSADVKCPEVLGILVTSRGSCCNLSSERRYSFGMESSRRLSAIAAISLYFCPILEVLRSERECDEK